MNGTELRSLSHYQILTTIGYQTLGEMFKLTILKFVFIRCKTVKVSQEDQIQM